MLALFRVKFARNLAISHPVFRWELYKSSVWESVKKNQDCALNKGLATGSCGLQVAKGCTRVKHAEELNNHTSWSTTGQKVQSGHSVSSRLGLATQSSCEAKSPVYSVWEKLTLCIPYTHQCKYPLYPWNVKSF